jgi:hypothetical protein
MNLLKFCMFRVRKEMLLQFWGRRKHTLLGILCIMPILVEKIDFPPNIIKFESRVLPNLDRMLQRGKVCSLSTLNRPDKNLGELHSSKSESSLDQGRQSLEGSLMVLRQLQTSALVSMELWNRQKSSHNQPGR